MAKRFPFGVIAALAAVVGISALLLDAFLGGAEALGRTNGSGHNGSASTSTAGYVAYGCAALFVITVAGGIVERSLTKK